jgi:hypothetical protein
VGYFEFNAIWAFSCPFDNTIWAQTLRMQIIPERLRGRTFALLRTLMQGANPVGGIIAGFLLPVVGIPAMISLSVVLIGTPGLLGYRVRDLRSFSPYSFEPQPSCYTSSSNSVAVSHKSNVSPRN